MPVAVTRNGTSSTGSTAGVSATDWAAAGAASASVARTVAGTSFLSMSGSLVAAAALRKAVRGVRVRTPV